MSYILDALRRAEAERERKRGAAAPSLLQPEAPAPLPTPAHAAHTARALPPAAWVAGGALVVGMVVVAALALRPGESDPGDQVADGGLAPRGQPPSTGQAMPAAEPAPLAEPETRRAPPAAVPSPPVSPGEPATQVPGAGSPMAPPVPVPTIAPPPAPATQPPPTAGAQPAAPTGATARPPAAAVAATPGAVAQPAALPTPPAPLASPAPPAAAAPPSTTTGAAGATALAPLPDALQRQLAISGSRYAEDPAQRLLIVNGQVVREGGALAPGLVLERILLRTAVIRHQGQRYELRY